ncbi:hypothetical protein HMPREF1633_11140 [Tissierellia bacterium S5-A11]|nr:hypothetical protein HMPREF1633_11140 [Tissierellia bacterium S5-A11]
MIWILGGTTEVNKLLESLGDDDHIITVATESGAESTHSKHVHVGRLTKEQMVDFARENKIDKIVDLTHPYATIVTDQARQVAREMKIPYYRYIRPEIHMENGYIVGSIEECCRLLQKIDEGPVFFTTGSKNIKDFEPVRGDKQFIYRILPTLESLQLAFDAEVSYRDIVAMLGPFSLDLNIALFKQYQVKYCVMKESGKEGGQEEKILACKQADVCPIIIKRQTEEDGYHDLNRLIKDLLSN